MRPVVGYTDHAEVLHGVPRHIGYVGVGCIGHEVVLDDHRRSAGTVRSWLVCARVDCHSSMALKRMWAYCAGCAGFAVAASHIEDCRCRLKDHIGWELTVVKWNTRTGALVQYMCLPGCLCLTSSHSLVVGSAGPSCGRREGRRPSLQVQR